MAIASIDLTCSTCGKSFVHRKKCYNRSEADSYTAWALTHISFCPECSHQQYRDQQARDLSALLSRLGITLPTIEGVSDKHTSYAQSARNRYLSRNLADIERYHEGMMALKDPVTLAGMQAAYADSGLTYDEGLIISLREAELYDIHIAVTSTSAREILDTIK